MAVYKHPPSGCSNNRDGGIIVVRRKAGGIIIFTFQINDQQEEHSIKHALPRTVSVSHVLRFFATPIIAQELKQQK